MDAKVHSENRQRKYFEFFVRTLIKLVGEMCMYVCVCAIVYELLWCHQAQNHVESEEIQLKVIHFFKYYVILLSHLLLILCEMHFVFQKFLLILFDEILRVWEVI